MPDTAAPLAPASVTLTANAARRIRDIIAAEGRPMVLRVSVSGGGCSGFSYGFELVEHGADDDIKIERDGAMLVVDPVSLEYMAGSEIDFVEDLIGQSFKINNPLAQSSCGCGTSFSV